MALSSKVLAHFNKFISYSIILKLNLFFVLFYKYASSLSGIFFFFLLKCLILLHGAEIPFDDDGFSFFILLNFCPQLKYKVLVRILRGIKSSLECILDHHLPSWVGFTSLLNTFLERRSGDWKIFQVCPLPALLWHTSVRMCDSVANKKFPFVYKHLSTLKLL